MAKYYGRIGFSTGQVEKAPGVFDEGIVDRKYYGDVIRNSRQLQEGQKVNDNLSTGNSISIVADAYANEHFFAIRYIEWAGVKWDVTDVEVLSPRLTLRLGGVYNGPIAPSTP